MSFKQGLTNFIGGVNDTMNMPSVAIGQVGEWLSPKGSKAEAAFRDFKNAAKGASDMGQQYDSAGYLLGRMAPGTAVFGALPAAGVLPVAATAGVEAAGLGTLSAVPELDAYVKTGGKEGVQTRGGYRKWVKKNMQKAEPIKVQQMQTMPRAVYKGNISL